MILKAGVFTMITLNLSNIFDSMNSSNDTDVYRNERNAIYLIKCIVNKSSLKYSIKSKEQFNIIQEFSLYMRRYKLFKIP